MTRANATKTVIKTVVKKEKKAVPNKTANCEFSYDTVYNNKTLDQWIQLVHKYVSTKSQWKYYPLKKACFGYDNFALSVGYIFTKLKTYNDIEEMCDIIHKGWATNYNYWKTNSPWLEEGYIAPAKKLGDDRRDMCACTDYKNLPEEEQVKDRYVAEFIKKMQ